jgi:hypothetical protein
MIRGAGCVNRARPDLWEPEAGNRPGPPDPFAQTGLLDILNRRYLTIAPELRHHRFSWELLMLNGLKIMGAYGNSLPFPSQKIY